MTHKHIAPTTELPPTLAELIKTFALAGTLSQQDIYRLIAIASGAKDALAGANIIIDTAEAYRMASTNFYASGISDEERSRRATVASDARSALFKLLSDRWFGISPTEGA
jgi:hypothetical protein